MPISSVKTNLVKPNLRLTGVGEKFAVEKIRFKVILTWSRLQRTLAREIIPPICGPGPRMFGSEFGERAWYWSCIGASFREQRLAVVALQEVTDDRGGGPYIPNLEGGGGMLF